MQSPINDNIEQESSHSDSDEKNSNQNQRSIVINKSEPLAKCNVLYLGTAIPSSDQRGIDSIQEPLSKRYPIDGKEVVRGIEAWLSVNENDLQIQFVHDPSVILYYPILSLVYCASIRFATRTEINDKFPNGWRFVPLDSPEAIQYENTQNPPLFSIIFRRTRSLPIDECYCFVTKTKRTALALVQACREAYLATNDLEQDCSKVPLYFKIDDHDETNIKEIDNEIEIVPALDEEQALDYEIDKDCSGFFYKTNQVVIDSWKIWEHHKQDIQHLSSSRSSSSFSSHSSYQQYRPRSRTSIPDIQKSQSLSTSNSIKNLSRSTSNVIRVERIKDVNSGRDVYIRWIYDTSDIPDSISSTKNNNYDFHVDFITDNQLEKDLSNKIEHLVLNNENFKKSITPNYEQNKIKKKHKYRDYEIIEDHHRKKHSIKTHKNHRHKYNQVINSSPSPFIQQQYPIPSYNTAAFRPQGPLFTYLTVPVPSYPNYINTRPAFWRNSM